MMEFCSIVSQNVLLVSCQTPPCLLICSFPSFPFAFLLHLPFAYLPFLSLRSPLCSSSSRRLQKALNGSEHGTMDLQSWFPARRAGKRNEPSEVHSARKEESGLLKAKRGEQGQEKKRDRNRGKQGGRRREKYKRRGRRSREKREQR